jgi:hypothetical protein
MAITKVTNLATGQEVTYDLPARDAVIAAYAQNKGSPDWATWNYEKIYGSRIKSITRADHVTWNLGDWTAIEYGETPKGRGLRAAHRGYGRDYGKLPRLSGSSRGKTVLDFLPYITDAFPEGRGSVQVVLADAHQAKRLFEELERDVLVESCRLIHPDGHIEVLKE